MEHTSANNSPAFDNDGSGSPEQSTPRGPVENESQNYEAGTPCFSYTEVFEEYAHFKQHWSFLLTSNSGSEYHGWSTGKGLYHDSDPPVPSSDFVFTVIKDRRTKKIDITVQSKTLRISLCIALKIPVSCAFNELFPLGSETLLSSYEVLKTYLQQLEGKGRRHGRCITELRLIRDLLLDRSVFEGIEFETLY
jgi:hypothetical protein